MATKPFNSPPTCLRCLRRSTIFTLPSSPGGWLVQARGKKTNTSGRKHKGVLVRLLGNIPKFGPKHSVMRVAPARMRNGWFAAGQAEYMTRARMSELNVLPEAIIMPDPLYMPIKKSRVDDSSVKEKGPTGNAALDLRMLMGNSGREPKTARPARSDKGAGDIQNMLDRMLQPEPVEKVEIKPVSVCATRRPSAHVLYLGEPLLTETHSPYAHEPCWTPWCLNECSSFVRPIPHMRMAQLEPRRPHSFPPKTQSYPPMAQSIYPMKQRLPEQPMKPQHPV
jgi:hypothetical protein